MEEQFYFLKMMQEHLGWTITICLIVLLMVISIFAKSLSGILGKYIQDSVLQKKLFRRKLIISKHPLFSKYRLLVNQRIKFLRCECPLRKKIFTDLMIIRIETYDKILKEFIKRDDINRLSVMEFQFTINELILKIFNEWEARAKEHGIPSVVIAHFAKETGDIRNLLIMFLQHIAGSTYTYEDNISRVSAVFDNLCGLEEAMIVKLEMSLDSMNGEISNSKYQGIKCQKCEICQSKVTKA